MTLKEFLTTREPVTAVEVFSDGTLVNVVIAEGELFGVVAAEMLSSATVMQHPATLNGEIISAGDMTFTTADYVMLSGTVE
jgi:hypothetical protein